MAGKKKRPVIVDGQMLFPSVTEAAKWLRYPHGSVIRAILNGHYVRGHTVDYYNGAVMTQITVNSE